jgi:hypothetical protein
VARGRSTCDGWLCDVRRTGGGSDGQAAFHAVQAGLDAVGGVVGAGKEDLGADQFELEAGGGRAAHVQQAGRDEVRRARQLRRTDPGGLRLQALALVLGSLDQTGHNSIRYGGQHDQIAQPPQQVLREPLRVLTGLDDLLDRLEHRRAVVRREPVHARIEQRVRSETEQRDRQLVRHPLRPSPTDQLVQHAQRVTHRTRTGPHHQRKRGRLDRHTLRLAQRRHVVGQHLRRDQAERVVVRTRPDRPDDLVGLGGGEDELEVRRRLLDQLQQSVEALRGHHVRLVDDVDLVAALDRREEGSLPQIAGVVHTAVRRRVDLDHVDAAGTAARQVGARLAHPARLGDRAFLAVDGTGEDPRTGGLSTPARSGEQVGMIDPVVAQRVTQRRRDMILPDHLSERLRAIPAIQRKGCFHARNPSAATRHFLRPRCPAGSPGGTGLRGR